MILASQSPRRQQLLAEAGFELRIYPANIDETALPHEAPQDLVARLARSKAEAVAAQLAPTESERILLAADTIVWQADKIFGKPASPDDATHMLQQLSGTRHQVSTGVCLMYAPQGWGGTPHMSTFVETSEVEFYPLTPAEIEAYVTSGEPSDKAGAYGIQGKGRMLVKHIAGDYTNIVGLPIARVVRELALLCNDPSLIGKTLS